MAIANPSFSPPFRSWNGAVINIVGASARAACASARRSGFEPHAADLFGDLDLLRIAKFHPLRSGYPEGLLEALAEMPRAPFLFTGGLEGRPELLEGLIALRPLWGTPPGALRRSRDPELLARVLAGAGARPPLVVPVDQPPPDPTGWLLKPRHGAGGRGIKEATHERIAGLLRGNHHADFYLQRRIPGRAASAVFVAARSQARLLGATEQLVGCRWLGANGFLWCGNVGPIELPATARTVLERCGDAAAATFGLVGLFGIDFLLDGDLVRPVELNPRYPASAEVLELAFQIPAVGIHAAACTLGELPGDLPPFPRTLVGKGILHATETIEVGELPPGNGAAESPHGVPRAADLPPPGTRVEPGRPALTVFAEGRTGEEVLGHLRNAALSWYTHLAPRRCSREK